MRGDEIFPNLRRLSVVENPEKLFDIRNLIDGVRLLAETMDDRDDLKLVMHSAARVSLEKVDEVTRGEIFDPPATERQMVEARASSKISAFTFRE